MKFLSCNPENSAILSVTLISFLLLDVAWRLYVGAETFARGLPDSSSRALLREPRSGSLIWNASIILLMMLALLMRSVLGLRALFLIPFLFGVAEQLYCAWLTANRPGRSHFHSIYFLIRDRLVLILSGGRDVEGVLKKFRGVVIITLLIFALGGYIMNITSFCLSPTLTTIYGWSILLLTYFFGAYCIELSGSSRGL